MLFCFDGRCHGSGNNISMLMSLHCGNLHMSVAMVWYHDCAWLIPGPMLSEKHSPRQEVALSVLVQALISTRHNPYTVPTSLNIGTRLIHFSHVKSSLFSLLHIHLFSLLSTLTDSPPLPLLPPPTSPSSPSALLCLLPSSLGHWCDMYLSLQDGDTPLMVATCGGHDGCVQFLLDRGAQAGLTIRIR